MARKPNSSPEAAPLTAVRIKQGIDRLRRRIEELERFDPTSVKERWAPETKAIQAAIDDTLTGIFGQNTSRYHRYQSAGNLDHGGLSLGGSPAPLPQVHKWLAEGKADALALLNQAVKSLEEDLAELPDDSASMTLGPTPKPQANDEIFVVHGRDDAAKNEVARVIERAGLKATILHLQPNAGKTIIEKFEKHGMAAGFAVVVVTPDDLGGPSPSDLKPRARQNVIGEMFWFAGRLGRDRVCVLIKDEVEMPSDIAGLGYTPMDAHGGWKNKLLQELDAAGYKNLDWKAALV
jgi:predicted nucleotide-binding protein